METNYPKKVNYQDYEHAFNSYWLKEFVEGQLRYFDTEKMRGLIYGYTFTEDYAKGIIPDALSAEYWRQEEGKKRITLISLLSPLRNPSFDFLHPLRVFLQLPFNEVVAVFAVAEAVAARHIVVVFK